MGTSNSCAGSRASDETSEAAFTPKVSTVIHHEIPEFITNEVPEVQSLRHDRAITDAHAVFLSDDLFRSMVIWDFDYVYNLMREVSPELDDSKGQLDMVEREILIFHLTEMKGLALSKGSAEEAMKKADGNETIDRQDFRDFIVSEMTSRRDFLLEMMNSDGKESWMESVIKAAMKTYDKGGNDVLDVDELTLFLIKTSEQLRAPPPTRKQVGKTLSVISTTGSLHISPEEFKTLIGPLLMEVFLKKSKDIRNMEEIFR